MTVAFLKRIVIPCMAYALLSHVSMGDDRSVRIADFVQQYKQESKSLREFYSNITIEAERTTERGDPPAPFKETVVYYGGGTQYRVDEPGFKGQEESLVSSPALAFKVRKTSETGKYFYLRAYKSGTELLESIRLRKVPLAPISFMEADISDFLEGKSFPVKIESVENMNSGGIAIIRVTVLYGASDRPTKAKLDFLKDDSYAVSAYEFGRTKANTSQVVCHLMYDGKDKTTGMPLLSQIHYWVDRASGRRTNEETYRITRLVPGPASADLFTPAAFDLPVPGPDTQPDRKRLLWLVLVLVLLCILVYRRWGKRAGALHL